jgi:acyl-CoA thioester hydrolase
LAASLRIDIPERAQPRSLGLRPSDGSATLADAERMGLFRIGGGAICATDCDVFGRMRPEIFIGRVSDGVPALAMALRASKDEAAVDWPSGVGGAVLEYRVAYHGWPRAGDRFDIRSGLAAVGDRTQNLVHWLLNPETGRAWGTAEAVSIALDLDARKVVPISPADQGRLRERIVQGLSI